MIMVQKEVIIEKIVEFANTKLAEIGANNPVILLVRPFFARAINNNITKLDSLLSMVADKDGMVDIEGIMTEMIDNLLVSRLTSYPKVLGGLEIGEGSIKLNVPLMNKQLVFDTNDIEVFKQTLIR